MPNLPVLWLNEGLTCRQLMVPGGAGAESQRAVDCAVAAFDRMRQLAPADPRGEQLYVQVLFDADRFETLAAKYNRRLQEDPRDLAAVGGLIQVYSRWNRIEEALVWYKRRAELLPRDAEAQYAVGVFIWQQLVQRGGGPEQTAFDPRPDPDQPQPRRRKGQPAAPPGKTPPPFALGDITGGQRLALADTGIERLQRAVALRPQYREAMIYLGLLHRQKAIALWPQPDRWQAAVDAAERWRKQAAAGAERGRDENGDKDGDKDAAGKGGRSPAR